MIKKNIDITEKTLLTIMKRFLSAKKDDPEIYKYFLAIDEVDFLATSDGSAINIEFENKYDHRNGNRRFLAPLPKGEIGELQELEDYPDVKSVFDVDLDDYDYIELNNVTRLIHLHESMHKLKTFGGHYHNALMTINEEVGFEVVLYGNEVDMAFVDTDISMYGSDEELEFTYDIESMIAILKGIKDLKIDEFKLYYTSGTDRIFMIANNTGYNFKFALAKKLVM